MEVTDNNSQRLNSTMITEHSVNEHASKEERLRNIEALKKQIQLLTKQNYTSTQSLASLQSELEKEDLLEQ